MQIRENEGLAEVKARAHLAGLRLPCILKDAVACGVPEAHHMWLILDWQGLDGKLSRTCLLQNFVNHSACLYKVYVLDSLVSLKQHWSVASKCKTPFDSAIWQESVRQIADMLVHGR